MRRRLRWVQFEVPVIVFVGVAILMVGCQPRPATALQRQPQRVKRTVALGSRTDAVIHEPVTNEVRDGACIYKGNGWRLTLPKGSAWTPESDVYSTLRLVRRSEGPQVVLWLKAYNIRPGMSPETFLAAHAMWVAEEAGPRIEYSWDKELQAWQGYAVSADHEIYYSFKLNNGRAYVLEESAKAGALDAQAVAEFRQIVSGLQLWPPERATNPVGEPATQ
ncbi:MAG: hypothetical protein ACUVX8_04875 [Candidatus Zipacnadales bacterium]